MIISIKKDNMDIQSVVAQLRQEASRIEQAIAALVGLGSQPARRGRPPKGSQAKAASGRKRRHMSAAARARIGAAKKAWWAKQKGKAGSRKGTPVSKKTTARKPMSAAMRKKLSAMMKDRWAQRRKAA
jgi:D-alanyl-D-alanine carboxypeptidase